MFENSITLGQTIIPLLKGVIYEERQSDLWNNVLNQQNMIREYIAVLNLTLIIDEAEGYAYLKQIETDDDAFQSGQDETTLTQPAVLPKLISKSPLNYGLSVLCVLLRKKMLEHDANGGSTRVILSKEQIVNLVQVYLPASGSQAKDVDKIHALINKSIEIGILRKMQNEANQYEVRRIIEALIDAHWLSQLDHILQDYQEYAERID
ncbi:DUF4194 domain-containing protein [Facilibium subflavum]|uniref:DUF4194 domain-containing protein n=1 Tax=Facilibium subflavum TaxID=2219058 RepID=UPI000E65EA0C|nr:DUF4194 domain-containing protein [Facilibium subflavum]